MIFLLADFFLDFMLLREVGREKSLTTRRERAREKRRAGTSASSEDWKKTESLVGRKLGRNEGTDQRPQVEGKAEFGSRFLPRSFQTDWERGSERGSERASNNFSLSLSVSLSTVLLPPLPSYECSPWFQNR